MIQAAAMKVFQFSSELQRMSVIARVVEEGRDGSFGPAATLAFCKGSPEAVARLCAARTLPPDYTATLERYAARGLRVLALACKQISDARPTRLSKMTRDQVEGELELLGLVIMENRLKVASVGVIRELREARIRWGGDDGDDSDDAAQDDHGDGGQPPDRRQRGAGLRPRGAGRGRHQVPGRGRGHGAHPGHLHQGSDGAWRLIDYAYLSIEYHSSISQMIHHVTSWCQAGRQWAC